jgi:hypothetical protein
VEWLNPTEEDEPTLLLLFASRLLNGDPLALEVRQVERPEGFHRISGLVELLKAARKES